VGHLLEQLAVCVCVFIWGRRMGLSEKDLNMLVLHLCHMHYWTTVMAKTWTKLISEET